MWVKLTDVRILLRSCSLIFDVSGSWCWSSSVSILIFYSEKPTSFKSHADVVCIVTVPRSTAPGALETLNIPCQNAVIVKGKKCPLYPKNGNSVALVFPPQPMFLSLSIKCVSSASLYAFLFTLLGIPLVFMARQGYVTCRPVLQRKPLGSIKGFFFSTRTSNHF